MKDCSFSLPLNSAFIPDSIRESLQKIATNVPRSSPDAAWGDLHQVTRLAFAVVIGLMTAPEYRPSPEQMNLKKEPNGTPRTT